MTRKTGGLDPRRRTTVCRPAALVCVLAVLAAGLATSAAADAPARLDTFTVDLAGTDPCDGFEILSSGTLTVRIAIYLDSRGAPVRVQAHAARDQTLTNSVNGKTIDLGGHVLVVIDLASGWQTWLGAVIMSNDRGLGSVLQDTGKIVFDADGYPVLIAGPHEGITNPESGCAALA